MFRTIGRVLLGFIVASIAAGLTMTGFAELNTVEKYISPIELILLAATHSAIFSAPFFLVATVIGEWLNIRSWLFYTLSGLAITMAGFLAQYSSEPTGFPSIMNPYAFTAFALTGLISGFVYWLIAGRLAGNEVPLPDFDDYPDGRRLRVEGEAEVSTSSLKDMLSAADKTSVPSTGAPAVAKKAAQNGI
jgi:hypothetical protein